MTIGERAFEAIRDRANQTGSTFNAECEKLGTSRMTINTMKRKRTNPGSWLIAEMYRQGYDIVFILTGERKMITGGDLCV